MKKLLLGLLCLSLLLPVACQKTETKNEKQENISKNEGNNNENISKKQKKDENKDRKENTLIEPKWGKRFYKAHNGKIEALEHIWLRHNFNSSYDNVSRFGKQIRNREELQIFIEKTLKIATKKDISIERNGDKNVTINLKKPIGLNQRGKPTSKMTAFLDDKDFVKTAYPL